MSGCITLGGPADSTPVLIVLRGYISFFIGLLYELTCSLNTMYRFSFCGFSFRSHSIAFFLLQLSVPSFLFILCIIFFLPIDIPSFLFSSYCHSKFSFFYAVPMLLIIFPIVIIRLFLPSSFDIPRLLNLLPNAIPRLLFLLPNRNLRFLFLLLLLFPVFSSFFFSVIPKFLFLFPFPYCPSSLFLLTAVIPLFLFLILFVIPKFPFLSSFPYCPASLFLLLKLPF